MALCATCNIHDKIDLFAIVTDPLIIGDSNGHNDRRQVAIPIIDRGNPTVPLLPSEEGDAKGWSTVVVIALGSWEKTVPRGHAS